ncbi:MAG: type IV pilus biogenesis/stability protein PilW [Woeseiaceae bacterium]
MKCYLKLYSLLLILTLTGCTAQVEREGVNKTKASIANSELGVAYLAKGNYKVAMYKLKRALDFDEDNVHAHHYIAELYRRLEQNKLAQEHFEIALDLNEEDSAIKNNYGIFLCGTGSYKKGMKYFNEVLLDPLYGNKGVVYENMGLCSEKLGNIRHAENYFSTALKFNKKLPSSLLSLAQIEFDKGHVAKASSFLTRHKKLSRPGSQAIWLELLIARKKGLKGRVGTLVIKLKQNFPESKETLLVEKLKLR